MHISDECHRPAEADAHSDRPIRQQAGQHRDECFANPLRAACDIDLNALAVREFTRLRHEPRLQLGAADFDRENVHVSLS